MQYPFALLATVLARGLLHLLLLRRLARGQQNRATGTLRGRRSSRQVVQAGLLRLLRAPLLLLVRRSSARLIARLQPLEVALQSRLARDVDSHRTNANESNECED